MEIITMEALEELCTKTKRYSLVFDIETGPLARDVVDTYFSPHKVKLGALKDQKKIEKKIEKERELFYERAPLFAHTGRVMAVGYGYYTEEAGLKVATHDETETDEKSLVTRFWLLFHLAKAAHSNLIGYNSTRFDLVFLKRRAWFLGAKTLPLMSQYGKPPLFAIDLFQEYRLGEYQFDSALSLDKLCRALGVEGKMEGVSGATFHKIFPDERERALEYLKSDIMATFRCAERMEYL
jgi:DNA polymerase elongation subunit (family B)